MQRLAPAPTAALLASGVLFTLLLLASGPARAIIDQLDASELSLLGENKTNQQCITEVNKNASKVCSAQSKGIVDCIKKGSKGKLMGTIEACTSADLKEKVSKAQTKGTTKISDKCGGSSITPDTSAIFQAAIDKELGLFHDIFGGDLDAVIAEPAQDDLGKCQVEVAKSAQKCQKAKLKEYVKCKKDGMKGKSGPAFDDPSDFEGCYGSDPKGKIAKACQTQMSAKIVKKCAGQSPAAVAPPSEAATSEELAVFVDERVECRVCVLLNQVDGLERDCDLFDDGQTNASCISGPALAAGADHTCLLAGGTLRCWGQGGEGRLGYANTNDIGDDESPGSAGDVDVGGTVAQISAGNSHSCAVLDTGAVRCWGEGLDGRLGYGNTDAIGDDEVPDSAGDVNVGGTVVQISAGNSHSCALLDTGAVRCWGDGGFGKLGYGNTDAIGDDEDPATAGDVNVGGTVVQIAAGGQHTCALLDTGAVRCWGAGLTGRLGYGNTADIGDDEDPATAGDVNVGGTVARITAGFAHTCALLDSGAVRCWGAAFSGQLGYGNTDSIGDDEVPDSAGDVNVGGTVVQISAGNSHSCAVLDSGAVRCWGVASSGQLGYGNTDEIGDDEDPATAGDVNVGGTVVQVALGTFHTCALLDSDAVRCWGAGFGGQLGYGNTDNIGNDEDPATAGDVNVGGTVVQVAAGGSHTCALLDTSAVHCWGLGIDGRLGYSSQNDIGDNESPASAGDVDVGGTVVQIIAGRTHTCALLDTGAVRCWGSGSAGRLGYGNTDNIGDNEDPATAGDVNVGGTVVQISAGDLHTCALLDTGAVRCWGSGSSGRLGYGNTDDIGDDEDPATAGDVDVGGTVVQIAAGGSHTCALLDTDAVRCWGRGFDGRLGYGNTDDIGDDEAPTLAGDVNVGGTVVQISAGGEHTCALLDTGAVHCWGEGGFGQLGYGNTDEIGDDEDPASAGDVNVGGTVVRITTGFFHTCGLLDTGALRCWGVGAFGRLGYGNTDSIGDDEDPATAGDVNVGGMVVRITAGGGAPGEAHTCALLDTGALRCWGEGFDGQLGYGNMNDIGDDEDPVTAGSVPVF